MKTLLRNSLSLFALAGILSNCAPAPNTGTTPGTEKASISGTVLKGDAAPGKNATVVLISKSGDKDSDYAINRTESNGTFAFSKVEKGNYRVAFTLATEDERKKGTPIMYDPNDGYTSDFFSFVTTEYFDYDGNAEKTFTIPTFNVGWKSNLEPHNKEVTFPLTFKWNPADQAKEYNVLVRDTNQNEVFKSKNTTSTEFTWDGKDKNGQALKAGTYYYLVNVVFNKSSNTPSLTYGGSALAKFTVK